MYRRETQAGGLIFSPNSANKNNLFERGEPVSLTFTAWGDIPADTTGFTYELRDYADARVYNGTVTFESGKKEYVVPLGVVPPGFYEARAFFTGSGGAISARSCIKASGSMPAGMGTFAVMPTTVEENKQRMQKIGQDAILGFMSPPYLQPEYVGTMWDVDGARWGNAEKDRPVRQDGDTAPWAKEAMKQAPRPKYDLRILNFMANHSSDTPKWAAKGDGYPGFDWGDYLLFVRDRVRVQKQQYPHMNPRVYDAAWEIEMNMEHIKNAKPLHTFENITETYRRAREVILAEDPGAIIIGPCTPGLSPVSWYRRLFETGFLSTVDALSIHPYHQPPPESANIPEHLRAIRELARRYTGKDLPVYSTELGYRGISGSTHKYRELARFQTRSSLILMGEGVRVHLPFYGYDFPGEPGMGYSFNLDPKLGFGPEKLAPKPGLPALAVLSKELLNAKPVRDLRFFGRNIWGYLFSREGAPVLVLWTTEDELPFQLPAGDVTSVDVISMMGTTTKVPVQNGMAPIALGLSPVYISGVDKDIYGAAVTIAASGGMIAAAPGETVRVGVVTGGPGVAAARGWGVAASVDRAQSNALVIAVPPDAKPTAFPVAFTASPGGTAGVRWVVVQEIVLVLGLRSAMEGGKPGLSLTVKNNSTAPQSFSAAILRSGAWKTPLNADMKSGSTSTFFIDAGIGTGVDPAKPVEVSVKVAAGRNETVMKQKLYVLAANRRGAAPDPYATATIRGAGSSGKTDSAAIAFGWDDGNLYINVDVADDVQAEPDEAALLWQADSIQVAVDLEPDADAAYNPLVGQIGKKNCEIGFALIKGKPAVYRYISFDPKTMPTGDMTARFAAIAIVRNEDTRTTSYRIAIPAKELGIDAFTAGKELGIALLVNDADGAGTHRTGLELFDGIMNGKDPSLFGRVTLK
ncbi:MAG: hypothetical protein FJ387_23625 [Verrucomicrobia bacterium]|nr:hypothetical protein [Verrucomicrobiota bacterium]